MAKFNKSVGVSIGLRELADIHPSFWERVQRGDPADDMTPFLVMWNNKVIGIFVPVNTSQAFQALAGQVLPNLDIYRQFPAVQQLVGNRDTDGTPRDRS